uniref:Ulp1 protease n=1 Tax=Oryza sativa subsp. japonica TaxID=39947 RepID=Q8LMC7_ORYSJ|nr:Putative Ulp1 protease [Oryza sativa Japonica Group]
MEMSAKGREMFGVRIRNPDFLQGEDVLWLHFKDVFDLYHLDALDVSLLSAWILMEIQRARRRGVYDTGFIDPRKINTEMIDKYEKDTEDNLVHLLTQQHFKTFILLPYNTEFHWVLLFFDLDACRVTVYDSMNKEEKIFDKVFQLIDRAWDRFRQLVRMTWKEKLGRRFHFPCAKQDQRTNLCGYYVCEYAHCLSNQIYTTRELDHIDMKDNLPYKDFITAVQEQLMGFINEEVLNPDGQGSKSLLLRELISDDKTGAWERKFYSTLSKTPCLYGSTPRSTKASTTNVDKASSQTLHLLDHLRTVGGSRQGIRNEKMERHSAVFDLTGYGFEEEGYPVVDYESAL